MIKKNPNSMSSHHMRDKGRQMNDKILDGQGNEIVLGYAYKFVFAMPGPDQTIVIAKEINNDGTVKCYDVCFGLWCESIKSGDLFRPLQFPFRPQDLKLITENGGQA